MPIGAVDTFNKAAEFIHSIAVPETPDDARGWAKNMFGDSVDDETLEMIAAVLWWRVSIDAPRPPLQP